MKIVKITLPSSPTAGFTIAELMVATGILAVAVSSLFALNQQVVRNLKRSTSASYASQLIQERMEQFRRASWTELTSNYPPETEDPADVGYDADPDEDGTVYVDDTYSTDFPYDLTGLDATVPGLQSLLATSTASSAQLSNVVETITVETYNPDDTIGQAYTGALDVNGDPVVVDVPGTSVGGTPIIVRRQNGTTTVDSFNPLLVLSATIRLKIHVSWTGTDGATRTKETLTLFTVEGDK